MYGREVALPRLLREIAANLNDTAALIGAVGGLLTDPRLGPQILDLERDLGRLRDTLARLAEGLEEPEGQ